MILEIPIFGDELKRADGNGYDDKSRIDETLPATRMLMFYINNKKNEGFYCR